MKTFRSTFEENYKAVPELSRDGRRVKMRYVYIGLWYVWNLPQRQVGKAKRLVGGACILSTLLFFAGGLTNSPLNYARYVQLPGMLSMAALVFEVVGSLQFCGAKERMDCMEFRDIRGKMLIATLLHGALLLWTTVAAVFHMISRGSALTDVVTVCCFTCSGLLSLAMFFIFRALPYRTEKNAD